MQHRSEVTFWNVFGVGSEFKLRLFPYRCLSVSYYTVLSLLADPITLRPMTTSVHNRVSQEEHTNSSSETPAFPHLGGIRYVTSMWSVRL
jgi:hypothetical protein